MNLYGMAAGIVGVVNPPVLATLHRSLGYVTADDGSRTATFSKTTGDIQVQALTAADLQHTNGLNLSGNLKKVFLDGKWNSIVRAQTGGGDLFTFGGQDWLVVHVLEQWPDWTSAVVSQQATTITPTAAAIYYGSSMNTVLDAAGIQALGQTIYSNTFAYSYPIPVGGYRYLAYPESLGLATSFIDQGTGFDVPMVDTYEVSIGGVDYWVHRSYWILGSAFLLEVK